MNARSGPNWASIGSAQEVLAGQDLPQPFPPDGHLPGWYLFSGRGDLDTDLNNANVLVGADQAVIVGWGWATKGAPWLDAAYWVVWLIAAGHDPDPAEQWARRVSTWADSPPAGVTAFATAQATLWAEIGGEIPDPWTARLVTASARWAQFRRDKA